MTAAVNMDFFSFFFLRFSSKPEVVPNVKGNLHLLVPNPHFLVLEIHNTVIHSIHCTGSWCAWPFQEFHNLREKSGSYYLPPKFAIAERLNIGDAEEEGEREREERERERVMSSSPRRRSPHSNNNDNNEERAERQRFFSSKAKNLCWAKAEVVPGRHPDRWRKDAVGNIVCKRFWNCQGCLCFEYDHIIPFSKGMPSFQFFHFYFYFSQFLFHGFSFYCHFLLNLWSLSQKSGTLGCGVCSWNCSCSLAGGESTADNCQILQSRVNRFKADKESVNNSELKGFSCDLQFTGTFSTSSFTLSVHCFSVMTLILDFLQWATNITSYLFHLFEAAHWVESKAFRANYWWRLFYCLV